MNPHLIYLLGAPGAGKTTALTAALAGGGWVEETEPLAHRRLLTVAWLGRDRATFGGTDTLPMNVARTAERWVASRPAQFMIGEGDRLAYGRFFDVAASAGYELHVWCLSTPEMVAEQRRAQRAAAAGTRQQNAAWVRGRRSKSDRLTLAYSSRVIDGARPAELIGAELRTALAALGVPPQALA